MLSIVAQILRGNPNKYSILVKDEFDKVVDFWTMPVALAKNKEQLLAHNFYGERIRAAIRKEEARNRNALDSLII